MKTLLVCRDIPYRSTSGSPLPLWQEVKIRRGPISLQRPFDAIASGTIADSAAQMAYEIGSLLDDSARRAVQVERAYNPVATNFS